MSSIGVLKIALLAGGTSSEREVSLKGAEVVKKALEKLGINMNFLIQLKIFLNLLKEQKSLIVLF